LEVQQSKYRRDIDGLRALAVLTVLFYHAGFGAFSGGYVGVDVFFVISGFLITGIIVREIQATGTFSFSAFYVRRMRRLFPALFFTVAVTFAISAYLFPPEYLQSLGASSVASLLSVANFFLWK
jgi:peptidoglycan/LPS O-acetylase OafA/YrhL